MDVTDTHASGDARSVLTHGDEESPSQVERRRDWETIMVIMGCLLLIGLVVGFWDVAVPPRTATPQVADGGELIHQVAPDFALTNLNGTMVRLADFKGKVVLINVWATWCPPCVRETPRLVRLADEYTAHGLVVLGVNATYQDTEADVRAFVAQQQMSYPVLLDPDNVVGLRYPTRLMPSTFLVDRAGLIRAVRVGEIDEQQLMEQISMLLAE